MRRVLVDEAYFEFYGQTMLGERARRRRICLSRGHFRKLTEWPGCAWGSWPGRRADEVGAAGRLPLQRECCGAGLFARCDRRSGVRRAVCAGSSRRRATRLERTLEANGIQFWPSRGEFRPDACGIVEGRCGEVCRADAGRGHSGARSVERSRMRGMRADHARSAGAGRPIARRAAGSASRNSGIAQGASRR